MLTRLNEAVVNNVHYKMVKQSLNERRMDACYGCAARWKIKLCDVIGACRPGFVYVEREEKKERHNAQ